MRERIESRRRFLSQVGQGMLVAGIGYSAARELGMAPAWAEEGEGPRLTFGPQERLVSLMQETPPEGLLARVVELISKGTELRDLVAAGALANARAFGGEDYVGFHTFMAMAPALLMSDELPTERRPLPVLKVLYRNAARLQESGLAGDDTLHPLAGFAGNPDLSPTEALRRAVHQRDLNSAEGILARAGRETPQDAWNALLPTVHEAPEVHRIVLAHRAWDMRTLVGTERALTMLRQSVHYCVENQEHAGKYFGGVSDLVVRLLDRYKLLSRDAGTRAVDDAWVESFVETLFTSSCEQAAEAVAAALGEGISADAVAEAVSLTANQLVLRDAGRPPSQSQPGKPPGSVHGDSIGVHASDSANAWRNIAQASNRRNAAASLILSGYQVALDRTRRGGQFDQWPARPLPDRLEEITANEPGRLLSELGGAIRENDQERACAVAGRYLGLGHAAGPVFDVLLGYATSEDGALHAEKYYWTTRNEFAATRPAFRNRQVIALARVTASQYGTRAPGYGQACELLGIDA